jgi:hypothetical protein
MWYVFNSKKGAIEALKSDKSWFDSMNKFTKNSYGTTGRRGVSV